MSVMGSVGEPAQPGQAAKGAERMGAQVQSTRGWESRLAAGVVGLLTLLSLTGLWLYFAPFSLFAELQLLVHVLAGLLLVLPFLVYQVRHLSVWIGQKWTVVMMIGYLLMANVLACLVSGGMVSWQAFSGPKLSPFWDQTHVIAGIATATLMLIHLAAALTRRWAMAARYPALRRAIGGFARRSLAVVVIGTCLIVAGWSLTPQSQGLRPVPTDYTLPDYAQQFEEYQGSPFAPSYARTSTASLIDPSLLGNSHSCGTAGCHAEIYQEWLPSAHRFAAMNPPFQQVQLNFARDREPAETRYCAGCHDPISLFAGAKDIHHQELSAPGMQEGCSCVACHAISSVDQRGNGDYVLTPPQKYLWEDRQDWRKWIADFLIRAYPRQHLADYDRTVLRTPEFCGACHKQFIPEALNRTGLSPSQNQYDEWRESHWNSDDPEARLSCVDCHMRLVRNSEDPGSGEKGALRRQADDGAHRHHGTIATNLFIPELLKLPNWEKHCQLTREWIRGETVIEEIADLWPTGPVATIKVLAPQQAAPGKSLNLSVMVANAKAGHNFTTGPLDFIRVWVHLRVLDATGAKLAEWGAIDPVTREITDSTGQTHESASSRREGTLVLESIPLDQEGNEIRRHELWNKAGGRGTRVIFPSYSDNQHFRLEIPATAQGPLRVEADLNYRRYRQEFLNLVLPGMEEKYGVYQPTAIHSSDTVTIELAPPIDAAEDDKKDPGQDTTRPVTRTP